MKSTVLSLISHNGAILPQNYKSVYFMRFVRFFMCSFVLLCIFLAFTNKAMAQDNTASKTARQGQQFETNVSVIKANVLRAGTNNVRLWGVDNLPDNNAYLKLRARMALSDTIGNRPVKCEIQRREQAIVVAQCVNQDGTDLGLSMIQQGYVSVNRSDINSTLFEAPYLQAERQAYDMGQGIWAQSGTGANGNAAAEGTYFITLGFILFLCIIGAFTVISVIIMRGFRQVITAQNDNMLMMGEERKLRDKERSIVAVMLDSELKANKSKIEAYTVVYEEILADLKNTTKPPKYKKTGDIVQKQPSLSRAVFDRNADKLDVLGRRLSSELIHFYARIKTTHEFVTLEPEMDIVEALEIVRSSLDGAQKLNTLAEDLIEAFEDSGVLMDFDR